MARRDDRSCGVATEREKFIEEAAAEFADNAELEMATRRELDAALGDGWTDKKWREARGRLGRRRFGWVPCIVAAVLLAGIARQAVKWEVISTTPPFLPEREESWDPAALFMLEPLKDRYAEEHHWLLFGDDHFEGSARWRILMEKLPGDAAAFAEHATAVWMQSFRYPEDFVARGEELDPGNGVFAMLMATPARPSVESRTYEIKDEAKFREGLKWVEESLERPRMAYLSPIMRARRAAVMPPPESLVQMTGQASLVFCSMSEGFALAAGHRLLLAETKRAHEAGDFDRARSAQRMWLEWMRRGAAEIHTMVDLMMVRAGLIEGSKLFRKLGLTDDLPQVFEIEAMGSASPGTLSLEPELERWSLLSRLVLPMFAGRVEAPTFTEAEVKPGRRAEHAASGQLGALGAAILAAIGLLGVRGLEWFRGRPMRRISKRASAVLSWRDHGWVIVLAVALPLALAMGLRHGMEPVLGFGISGGRLAAEAVSWVAVVVMMGFSAELAAGWRLRRGGAVRASRLWLAMIGCSLAAIALVGVRVADPPSGFTWSWWPMGVVAGALVAVAFRAGLGLAMSGDRAIAGMLQWRLVRPALWTAVLVCVGLAETYQAEERWWFRLDGLSRLEGNGTELERRFAEKGRAEMVRLLEEKREDR